MDIRDSQYVIKLTNIIDKNFQPSMGVYGLNRGGGDFA